MSVGTVIFILFLEESKFDLPELNGQVFVEDTVRTVSSEDTEKGPVTRDQAPTSKSSDVNVRSHAVYTRDSKREDRIDPTIKPKTYWQRHALTTQNPAAPPFGEFMVHSITRPFLVLFNFPAVAFSSLQYGWTVTLLVVCATTQATLLPSPPYSFSSIGVGNMTGFPSCIGAVLGSTFGGPVVDWMFVKVADRRNGIYEPETRLWPYMLPGVTGAAGMWMYGLTISKVSSWNTTDSGMTR